MAKNELGMTRSDKAALKNLMPGEASDLVVKLMAVKSISANANVRDPDSLRGCFYAYIQFCMQNDLQVTNLAAYQAMGITDNQIKNWHSGKTMSKDPRYKDLADEVLGFCSAFREQLMAQGKVNPVTGIWWQKVYDKYTDIPQPDAKTQDLLGDDVSAEAIAEKYKDIPE